MAVCTPVNLYSELTSVIDLPQAASLTRGAFVHHVTHCGFIEDVQCHKHSYLIATPSWCFNIPYPWLFNGRRVFFGGGRRGKKNWTLLIWNIVNEESYIYLSFLFILTVEIWKYPNMTLGQCNNSVPLFCFATMGGKTWLWNEDVWPCALGSEPQAPILTRGKQQLSFQVCSDS